MSELSKDDVKKIARLARLKMEDDELERRAESINGILQWMEQLNEVDTDNVEPLRNVADIELALREDVMNDGGYPDKVLSNAPEETQGFYVVPKVVE
ncbi:MAG: Asp-tRNA(Asn)/Glu-tRNA(Gln) amidotransferase subunit GatC [Alphaproteobacteria bacterium]|nr:Asp-tRNA(Asn)/Glu-tRNA(Gln) amidotransferase subunit GatC [Alphaproteobacteria bacterium]